MRRALALVLLVVAVSPAAAQRFVIGLAGAGGDYREVSNDLRYRLSGVSGSVLFDAGRFAGELVVTGLTYEPDDAGGATATFKAAQFDGYGRVLLGRGISLEAGVTNRKVESKSEYLAQSAAAVRVGLYSAVALGSSAGAHVRFNYLAGAKFSGGGNAPLALDVGLGFYYGFARGRLRITGESQFQRFNRKVDGGNGERDVPIQQIVGRLGLAVVL